MKIIRYLLLISIPVIITLSGCTDKKFDPDRWYYGDGVEFPFRDKMLDDLLQNHQLKGMKYAKMIGMLGRPQGVDSTGIYYEVKLDIDKKTHAITRKLLVINFSKDSVVTDYKVTERK